MKMNRTILKTLAMALCAVLAVSCGSDDAPAETIETLGASELSYHSAIVSGRINVSDEMMSAIEFGIEYSEQEAMSSPKTVKSKVLESGNKFKVTLENLNVGTEYYYRAYVKFLANGTVKYGALSSFTTLVPKTVGHDYVDLGLPSGTLWATCNVGADKPEDCGGYYAWGETEEKDYYDWSTYKYCKGSSSTLTKYCSDSSYGYNGFTDTGTVLESGDDVAHVKWGGDWRMPTDAEWSELRSSSNCTWTWYGSGNTEFGGTAGYKVTGRKSGYESNFIFLPAAGYRGNGSLGSVGSYGGYWSSSLYESRPYSACYVGFDSGNYLRFDNYRYYGRSVRPVCP